MEQSSRKPAGAESRSAGMWSPEVYDELVRMARHHLRTRANGSTLCTTDLLHEAYFKLDRGGAVWESRGHFFASAARAIRQVLVDHARRRAAEKRGAGVTVTTLRHAGSQETMSAAEVLALDDALDRLAGVSDRLARVVEMRFFGGFGDREIAAALGVSERTVERDWIKARLFLAHALAHG